MNTPNISYTRHRFQAQIFTHAAWLYFRFNLSLRETEEVLLERGIDISYETIRRWTVKFGPQIARNLRRRQARPSNVWHLDEVAVKIAGRSLWLWRRSISMVLFWTKTSVQSGEAGRETTSGHLLKGLGFVSNLIVTGKLRSSAPPRARSHRVSITGCTRSSTIARKTVTCRFESENGAC